MSECDWKIRFGTAGTSDSFEAKGYKSSLDIPAYTAERPALLDSWLRLPLSCLIYDKLKSGLCQRKRASALWQRLSRIRFYFLSSQVGRI